MACPDGSRYNDALNALDNGFDIWEAAFCTYAVPAGELVVGLLFYGAVSLGIFVRTGSAMIPFILVLILGGTILAQMAAIVSQFAAVIILIAAPIIISILVFQLDRR
jgi:hypothetical protein